jgi:molybdenum cofactor cytidylyltransferase
VDATILMTCDQPAVTGKHLQRLIELHTDTPVASLYAGRSGVPACFPAADFTELSLLAGEEGARRLLQSALAIELVGGELDIDTPQTLALAKSIYERGTELDFKPLRNP